MMKIILVPKKKKIENVARFARHFKIRFKNLLTSLKMKPKCNKVYHMKYIKFDSFKIFMSLLIA